MTDEEKQSITPDDEPETETTPDTPPTVDDAPVAAATADGELTEDADDDGIDEPIIPPNLLVGLTIAGIVVAFVTLLLQGQLGVIGYASLVVGVISLVALIVTAPRVLLDAMSGRTFRFGGTSVLVTLIFIIMLMVVYWFVAELDLEYDLTQTDEFSLNEDAQPVLTSLGADPNVGPIEILGFYDSRQLNEQGRTEALLRDYERISGGKITYDFVNPDRSPLVAEQFGAQGGQLVVVGQTVEGERDVDNAEVVDTRFAFDQNQLTNAVLAVSASGDFRGYFLSVTDGISIDDPSLGGVGDLRDILVNSFNWQVEEFSYLDVIAPDSEIELGAPTVDGEVLTIVGGSQELGEDELAFITDYVDAGGSLVIFAAPSVDGPSLASTEALNSYLAENFGLSFGETIVLDTTQAYQVAEVPVVTDFDRANFITQTLDPNAVIVFPLTRTIEVAEATPENVTVVELASTSGASYGKSVEQLIAQEVEQVGEDPDGPFVVMAAADNSDTGARVVLVGSQEVPTNQWALVQQTGNQQISFNALVWATRFDEFFEEIPRVDQFDVRPQDQPVFATADTLRTISFISVFLLPLSVLGLGVAVWWLRRADPAQQ